MAKAETGLVQEARRVARLQTKRTRLLRELKAVQAELKQAQKNLRKLAASIARDPFDQTPPIRGMDT